MTDRVYPCYVQKKDQSGQWYWIFYAKNYEAIARSSESYHNRSDCEHSINLMKNSAEAKVYTE